jgi:hypothetical protein
MVLDIILELVFDYPLDINNRWLFLFIVYSFTPIQKVLII